MKDGIRVKLLGKKVSPEKFHSELGAGLGGYNFPFLGKSRRRAVCVEARSKTGELIGGVSGEVMWDCLQIGRLWVHDSARKSGLGGQLLARAEREGRRMGAKNSSLDTWEFQAPGFYRKQGYEMCGKMKDCPTGHTKYWFSKRLK